MKVLSVNLGKPTTFLWNKKEEQTGMFKFPVDSPIFLGKEVVKNDTIVNRKHHGGIDQAVYGYSQKHYGHFKELHPNLEWQFGMFGENITFSDLDEEEITVGSIYQLGETKIEVTKPRQPCYKLGIRFDNPLVVKQMWNSSMSGIYFKVLETGKVKVGDELILLEKPDETPTIAEVYNTKK